MLFVKVDLHQGIVLAESFSPSVHQHIEISSRLLDLSGVRSGGWGT